MKICVNSLKTGVLLSNPAVDKCAAKTNFTDVDFSIIG